MRPIFKLTIVFVLFSALCSLCSFSHAAIPRTMNYQGVLTDSTGKRLSDGVYNVTFRIYDSSAGTTPLWSETQSVTVQKGIFNVLIGGTTTGGISLAFDKQYYLGIQLGSDTEMRPLQQLASSAYAIRANVADDAASLPRGAIIMWSGSIASIPQGWALCDGANSTPDLRSKFIVGAGSTYSVGATGGSISHSHSGTTDTRTGGGAAGDYPNVLTHSHNHTFTTNNSDHLPPYYALAYIMKL